MAPRLPDAEATISNLRAVVIDSAYAGSMRTILALAVILGACGGGGGGGGSVAIGDFGTQLSDTLCKKAFTCCTQLQLSTLFQSTTTLTTTAQCDTYVDANITGFAIPRYMASIAAGRVTYDGAAASACLDAISSATCPQFGIDESGGAIPAVCAGFLVPAVAAAGACTQNYECTTGYCHGAVTAPTQMDGQCEADPTMGQACDSTCAAGLYCDQSTLKCLARKADGASCTIGNECTSGGCITSVCGFACAM